MRQANTTFASSVRVTRRVDPPEHFGTKKRASRSRLHFGRKGARGSRTSFGRHGKTGYRCTTPFSGYASERHPEWPAKYPTKVWSRKCTIGRWLAEFAELLNCDEYTGV